MADELAPAFPDDPVDRVVLITRRVGNLSIDICVDQAAVDMANTTDAPVTVPPTLVIRKVVV